MLLWLPMMLWFALTTGGQLFRALYPIVGDLILSILSASPALPLKLYVGKYSLEMCIVGVLKMTLP